MRLKKVCIWQRKEKVGKKIMVRCKLDGSLHNRCRIDCPHMRWTARVRIKWWWLRRQM